MILTPKGFEALVDPVPEPARHSFLFRGAQLLLREPDLSLPEATLLEDLAPSASWLPVGRWEGAYCRAAWVGPEQEPPPGHAFKGLRGLFGRVEDAVIAIAGRAFQVAEWARTHRFCGACAEPMSRAAGERAMKCPCGHLAYPRISPAMMVLIKRGAHILLARNIAVPPGGRMSALAGFLEAGESIEEAVHREVREEVGLRVKDLRYFASQPWPFPHSLMIAFTAEYDGGEIRTDPNEIAEARWFGPGDTLPELPPKASVSRALIEANLPPSP